MACSQRFDPSEHPPLSEEEMESFNQSDRLFAARFRSSLEKQIAILPGSFESERFILFFPCTGMKCLEQKGGFDDYQPTIEYFTANIPEEFQREGVTIIINGRNVPSAVSKQLLEQLTSFPCKIKEVYLMKTSGPFGLKRSVVNDAIAKRIHLVYVYEPVLKGLPSKDLPMECKGELDYDHKMWLLHRLIFERMQFYYLETKRTLKDRMAPLKEKLVVECFKDIEQLLSKHLTAKEEVVTEITETREIIKRFTRYLSDLEKVNVTMSGTREHVLMVNYLRSLEGSLDEEEAQFNVFWGQHKAILDHQMKLGYFLRSVDKVKGVLDGHLTDLLDPDISLGVSLEEALENGQKFEIYISKVKETADDYVFKLQEDGRELRKPVLSAGCSEVVDNPYQEKSSDRVATALKDVAQQYQIVMKKCQQKRDLYMICVKYYMSLKEIKEWNNKTSALLSEDTPTDHSTEAISLCISRVDGLQECAPQSAVDSVKQYSNHIANKSFKKMSTKMSSKYQKLRDKLDSHRTVLLKLLAASFQPPPSPPSPPRSPSPMSQSPTATDTNESHPNLSSPDSADGGSLKEENFELMSIQERSRRFVYNELVATEKDYIQHLKSVIRGYYEEMSPDNNRVPVKLRGRRPTVFGNLIQIYEFHSERFLDELEKYSTCPEYVGKAFTELSDGFELYEEYCKNRPDSEELLQSVTEAESVFFFEIQQLLGHQLPLASYLLKPVQRITKYQLLLKDMIKYSEEDDSGDIVREDLMAALDKMLNILKYLNNSMKVIGLKGFPGGLVNQGRLLIQDVFQITEVDKQGREKLAIFSRPKRQNVFLFEKVLVFSKDETASSHEKRQTSFQYKHHIPLNDLGLRDVTDGQSLDFTLIHHSQQKSYKLTATRKDLILMWTAEIRRLLEEQFTQAKNARAVKSSQPAGDQSLGLNIQKIRGQFRASLRHSKTRSKPSSMMNGSTNLTSSSDKSPGMESALGRSCDSFESDDLESANATEESCMYESLAPGATRDYIAISDYCPGSAQNDIGLIEGQQVELVGVNQYGWWWVRATSPDTMQPVEGWVPAGYLQPLST